MGLKIVKGRRKEDGEVNSKGSSNYWTANFPFVFHQVKHRITSASFFYISSLHTAYHTGGIGCLPYNEEDAAFTQETTP